jgi:phosphoribosylglycinamide formyltransferase 2
VACAAIDGVEGKVIVFDGVAHTLRVPNIDVRLVGKPESFVKRRMGAALAFYADVARMNAKKAVGMVKPRLLDSSHLVRLS